MADFLSNLVARAFDRGPRLQRRVPSLFEPPPQAGARGWIAPGPSQEVPGEEAHHAAESEPGAPRPGIPERAAIRIEPAPAIEAPRAAAPPARRSEADARGEDRAAAPRTDERRGRPSLERTAEDPAAGRGVEHRRAGPVIAPEMRLDHTVVAPPVELGARTAGIARLNGARAESHPAPEARRSERREAAARESGTPAPTITVTIGRVEVRALPAPAAKARAGRDAAPRLNLDDYLRQRGRSDE